MFSSSAPRPDQTVILSDRAYAEMVNETLQNIRTETGGILLGVRDGAKWYVIESLDPGPNSIYQAAFFQYDEKYVTHLANKVRMRYRADLRLMGLWHRHPGSLDRFSQTDDGTNSSFVQVCGGWAISGLVNIDPVFRMTFYVASGPPLVYQKASVAVGNAYIPDQLLELRDARGLLDSMARTTGYRGRGATPVRQAPAPVPPPVPPPPAPLSPAEQGINTARQLIYVQRERAIGPLPGMPGYLGVTGNLNGLGRGLPSGQEAIDAALAEMDFLSEQQEYTCALEPEGSNLRLVMTRNPGFYACPERLEFVFANAQSGAEVMWKGNRYPCTPRIVRVLVNTAFQMHARGEL